MEGTASCGFWLCVWEWWCARTLFPTTDDDDSFSEVLHKQEQ